MRALPWNLLGVAICVQMSHAFFMTPMLEVQGPTAAVLPGLIIVVGVALLAYARRAQRRGWLA